MHAMYYSTPTHVGIVNGSLNCWSNELKEEGLLKRVEELILQLPGFLMLERLY